MNYPGKLHQKIIVFACCSGCHVRRKQFQLHFFFSVPLKSSKEGADEEQHTFVTGDVVEVFEGDLANLKGTILSIEGNKITIMPKHEDLKVSAYCISTKITRALCCRCCIPSFDLIVLIVNLSYSVPN